MDLGLNEAMDHLAVENSECRYGHVLNGEYSNVLRSARLIIKRRKVGQIGHGRSSLKKKTLMLT